MENTEYPSIPNDVSDKEIADGQNPDLQEENCNTNSEIPKIQDKTADKKGKKRKLTFTESLYESISVIVMAFFSMTLIFTFVFRIVGVSGTSMYDTLDDGEWLIVSPYYVTQPQYGDIVISTHRVTTMGPIVKRVIATAGDTVEIHTDGSVYVNGEKLNESSYIDPTYINDGDWDYPITVPDGYVFLLGDNRGVSADSRYQYVGLASVDMIFGKALIRLSENWNIYENFKV